MTASSPDPIPLPSYTPREIGEGLVLRSATEADAESLAAFNAMVHGGPPDVPDVQAAIWTRDLLRGDHPTSPVSDHAVIVEKKTGRIVSSCLLISQRWTFGGIPLDVGRPELVGTHPDYRGRGLIGTLFDVIHRRGAERGQLMQALTGVPNFYRRFGYEPSLIASPPQIGYPTSIDDLPVDAAEPFRFRPVIQADLPFVVEMYERSTRRSLIAAVRDESMWRYELMSRDPGSDYVHDLYVIETLGGAPIGLVSHLNNVQGGTLYANLVEVRDGVACNEIVGPVLRFLRSMGETIVVRDGGQLRSIEFDLPASHPFLRLAGTQLPRVGKAFAWDVRVPDLHDFLRHVAPLLERRLAESAVASHSGELPITFYRSGMRLVFVQGRLEAVEPWLPDPVWQSEAAFPGQSFLYLLFGSRSLGQLETAFPDCRIRSDLTRVLLETLFPVSPSVVWPIG